MKKKRGLLAIGGVILLGLLIGIYLVLKNVNQEEETKENEEEQQEESIVEVEAENIKTLVFQLEGEKVTWVQEDGAWSLEGWDDFPVDAGKISNLTAAIKSLKAGRTLNDIQNLQDYGLKEPVNTVQVTLNDGTTETIHIGNKNPSTNDTYVYLDEEKEKVYTVADDLGTTFSGTVFDFAKGEEYPSLVASSIKKIEVTKKENSYIVENTEDSSTGWYVTDEAGGQKKADSTEASSLQSTIAGMGFSGYYAYDCEDWSAYGLDKPRMELKIVYTQEDTTEEEDEDKKAEPVTKEMTLYVGNRSQDGNYYVRLNDSAEVHGISQSTIDTIKNGEAFDYWNKTMDGITLADMDHLDVTYGGKTYTMKQTVTEKAESSDTEEETKTVTTYYVNDEEVDGTDFASFYNAALGVLCQERLREDGSEGEPELTLVYVGKGGETVTVTYTKRDANFYTAADSNENYGLVNKMDVKGLVDKLAKLI